MSHVLMFFRNSLVDMPPVLCFFVKMTILVSSSQYHLRLTVGAAPCCALLMVSPVFDCSFFKLVPVFDCSFFKLVMSSNKFGGVFPIYLFSLLCHPYTRLLRDDSVSWFTFHSPISNGPFSQVCLKWFTKSEVYLSSVLCWSLPVTYILTYLVVTY